jgi:hypothetical protein
MEDKYDDTTAIISYAYVAFASSHSSIIDMSGYLVVESTCLVNLTTFRSDLTDFQPPFRLTRVGGVCVIVKGSGTIRVAICIGSRQTVFRLVHALHTHDLTSRSAHHIGHVLIVSLMLKHSGCEFLFPTNSDSGMLLFTTEMGMPVPYGNGLYLLPRTRTSAGLIPTNVDIPSGS